MKNITMEFGQAALKAARSMLPAFQEAMALDNDLPLSAYRLKDHGARQNQRSVGGVGWTTSN